MAICGNAILYRSTPVPPLIRRPSCSYPGALHRSTSALDRPVARHLPGRGRSPQAEEQVGKKSRIPPERLPLPNLPLLQRSTWTSSRRSLTRSRTRTARRLASRPPYWLWRGDRDRSLPTRSPASKTSPISALYPLSPLSPLPAPGTRGAQPRPRPHLVTPEPARRITRLSSVAWSLEWRAPPAMRVYEYCKHVMSCS
jgi:hypothetical protein